MKHRYQQRILIAILSLGIIACSFSQLAQAEPTQVSEMPTPIQEPTEALPTTVPTAQEPTEAPTAVIPTVQEPSAAPQPLPILYTESFSEYEQSPKYEIQVSYPALNNFRPAEYGFNEAVFQIIDEEIENFYDAVDEVEEWRVENMPESFSTLYIDYSTFYATSELISIKFNISLYAAGAAHPYPYTVTLNYDLKNNQKLELSDLFPSSTKYLVEISDYCIGELQTMEEVWGEDLDMTAGPTLENYRNWNIGREGILVTYDVYQVASYSVGPITVFVPYDVFGPILLDEYQFN